MLNVISQHQFIFGMLLAVLFNAAVSSMPSPDQSSSKGYAWFFAFTHTLMLNFGRLAVNFAPNSKIGQFFENGNGPKPPEAK